MKKIEWGEMFSVNVSEMDEEHKSFIYVINKVIAAMQKVNEREIVSEVLNEMTLYALSHFKTDEKYMIRFEYQGYHLHKKEHQDFLRKTIGFCKRVTNGDYNITDDLFEYLKQWLSKHIQECDRKYAECFKKNGLI